uniref:Uncharacterized protein n=1 Tax=Panagrolaimus sp. JU765 TaxID=591449 RepID=A0AC34RCN2_9BILA
MGVQYKTLPYFMTKEITSPQNDFLILMKYASGTPPESLCFCSIPSGKINVSIYVDIHGKYYHKIVQGTKIIEISSKWKNIPTFYPKITFTKTDCSVEFIKNGLNLILKDGNNMEKIPTAISFDTKIPLIGKSAVDDGKFTRIYDFGNLMDEKICQKMIGKQKWLHKSGKTGQMMILFKTFDGWKKETITKMFSIFLKSIILLIEDELEWKIPGLNLCFENKITNSKDFKIVENLLGIELKIC